MTTNRTGWIVWSLVGVVDLMIAISWMARREWFLASVFLFIDILLLAWGVHDLRRPRPSAGIPGEQA